MQMAQIFIMHFVIVQNFIPKVRTQAPGDANACRPGYIRIKENTECYGKYETFKQHGSEFSIQLSLNI